MSFYFFDTSALAKRYLTNEAGSSWVESLTQRSAGNLIIISELTTLEMISVFMRLHNEKRLTSANMNTLEQTFLADVQDDYQVMAVDSSVLVATRDIIKSHNLRT